MDEFDSLRDSAFARLAMDNEKFRGRIKPQIMAQELAKVGNSDGGSLEGQVLFFQRQPALALCTGSLHWLNTASAGMLVASHLHAWHHRRWPARLPPPSFCFIQVDSIREQIEAELSRIIGKLLLASSEGVKGARDLSKHRPYVKYHDDDRAVWAYLVKHSKAFKVG